MATLNRLTILIFVFFLQFIFSKGSAETTKMDGVQISLLTCSPDDSEVYSFFGHSGIRVRIDSANVDMVFDYGVFSFDSPNFIFKFIKGDTDYMVVNRPYSNFYSEYSYRGMGVREQIFNLTDEQKKGVIDFLSWNIKPENRVYRYNFLEDNCSTRIRDIITSQFVENDLHFKNDTTKQTYRDIINEHLVLSPWYKMGINIIIGSRADTLITERQKDFIPEYLYNSFDNAYIQRDSINAKLVSSSNTILNPNLKNQNFLSHIEAHKNVFDTPFYFGIILILLSIIMTIYCESKYIRWIPKLFDFTLFFVASLAGIIIFYLMFFSTHPCVGANWNLMWLNPLPILLVPLIFIHIKYRTKYVLFYHFINFALISIFILGVFFIPQNFEKAIFPYVFLLWMRSGYKLLLFRRK